MSQCDRCGSYAINHHCHGRDGSDGDLCDVCYWRKRAERQLENNLQCWDYCKPEIGSMDADVLAEHFAENMRDDEEESFRVMVSVPQPDRIMVVRLSGGDKRRMTWRWWE